MVTAPVPALITFVHYARARGGAEPAAGRFSFCESGWRRSRSVRRRRRAQRATGSTSPPAACTGKLMGLGRVLAPRFQPCPLSVGGTAPRAALAFFLALALAVAVELRGQDRRRPLAPGGSRAPKITSALNLHPKGPALTCFVHYTRARGGAEPAAGPFSFFFLESGWRRSGSGRAAAAPSTASYGVDVAAGGLHRQADGSRPCARSKISAVHFIRWRYGAARRAGFLFGLGLGRGRRAMGSGSPPAARTRRVSRSEIASALNLHPKGPALTYLVHYTRARGGASLPPADFLFSF